MRRPRIAIVGAGIGGLTLAVALAEAGARAVVFEQAQRLTEVGAGVQLSPNGVRPLHELGLGPVLRQHAVPIEAMEFRGWAGGLIARTPLGAACEGLFGAPYYAIHRAHLQQALLGALDPGRLRLGHRLTSVEQDDDEVRLVFADGTTESADVVVGADGIHSAVRGLLVRDAPVFAGLGAFRGLVPANAAQPLARMWVGPGRHFVCYPVAGGALYSFAGIAPLRDAPVESWSAQGDPADLVRAFDGWADPVATVTRAAVDVRQWALYDREPLRRWSTGRVTVLGDAAHPMLPFLSQGANQAIEDAIDLAAGLAGADRDEIPELLTRYGAARASRTTAIQRGSRDHAQSLHLPDGIRQRERDHVMRRSAGLRAREWLYGYRAGTAPAPLRRADG